VQYAWRIIMSFNLLEAGARRFVAGSNSGGINR